jgi:hypothetical protein
MHVKCRPSDRVRFDAERDAEALRDLRPRALADAGDRDELFQLTRERAGAAVDLLAERLDRLVEVVEVGEDVRAEQRVVG